MNVKFISFLAGSLFGAGLVLAQMTNPNKVRGFLDFFGNWDPTLVFVLGAAVGLHLITYNLILKRHKPVFNPKFNIPQNKTIDKRLIIGSTLFGIGWGLGGYCPAPGAVSVMSFTQGPLIFFASMIVGMLMFKKFFEA